MLRRRSILILPFGSSTTRTSFSGSSVWRHPIQVRVEVLMGLVLLRLLRPTRIDRGRRRRSHRGGLALIVAFRLGHRRVELAKVDLHPVLELARLLDPD